MAGADLTQPQPAVTIAEATLRTDEERPFRACIFAVAPLQTLRGKILSA
jgi:hypothetical protein